MEIQNPFQIQWDRTPYQSFTDYFFNKIASFGSNLALVDQDTGRQWRYSEIRVWCQMAVDRLKEIGVTEKSRVAVITGTTGQAVFVYIACSMIGCSAVAVNGHAAVDEIWQMVDLSESTQCIVEHHFLQKADDVRRKAQMRGGGRIKSVKNIEDILSSDSLSTDRKHKERSRPPPPILSREPSTTKIPIPLSVAVEEANNDLAQSPISETANSVEKPDSEKSSENAVEFAASSGNPFMLFFTSGTTGMPKVVELSHRSLIINLQQISSSLYGPVQPKERFLLPLTINHMYGMMSVFYALVNGAVIYTLNRWTPKTLIETLSNMKVNVVHCTAPMLHVLAMDPIVDNCTFTALRSVVISGSPIDVNLMKTCRERLKIRDIRQAFGMSELGGLCALPHVECTKFGSVGMPLPGMLFKIVNWDTKQLCGPRQPGQLFIMGPQVMPSYFKNQKATAEIMESSGYVRTGDAAYYDEDGHIFIMDRMKDIIKYKGTLVCPSEVETLLRAHPGIDDCAVVGRQDHVTGEVPAAFVVKSSSMPLLSSAEVRQYVSGKIAQFKELRGGVFFVSDIPRSSCGKVQRRNLRQFWDRERTNSKADLLEKPKLPPSGAKSVKTATKPGPRSNSRTGMKK